MCVYCRQPDSSAPNLNFGVDHYRPKSIPRFASLLCDYQNLYYCCSGCNSRKNNYWPADEKLDPFIVNPCDYIMGQHLRFEGLTGLVSTRTRFGEYTEELLQLNDKTLVEFRKTTLLAIKMASREIDGLNSQMDQLRSALSSSKVSQKEYDQALIEIHSEIRSAEVLIENYTGSKPTPILQKKRLGVTLSSI